MKKAEWLRRHDRDCGDLYGMLPFCKGMPVSLTDHVDRSPDKNLLRGRVGYVHSWVLHPEDDADTLADQYILKKMPSVVFVKFPGATWRIDGMKDAGVYPIRPVRRCWALDKGRKVPRLRIKRQQLPFAPAFAMTAHASQGQTLDAAIVDLCIGKESSPRTGYVALSRVRRREDILIFRPFQRTTFTRQRALGPELLLRHLRGDLVDWTELEEIVVAARRKRRRVTEPDPCGFVMCVACGLKPRNVFSGTALRQTYRKRKCEDCRHESKKCRGEETCRGQCGRSVTRAELHRPQSLTLGYAICKACVKGQRAEEVEAIAQVKRALVEMSGQQKIKCASVSCVAHPRESFSSKQLRLPHGGGRCKACM